jgi:cytoskeletal protein RodZ
MADIKKNIAKSIRSARQWLAHAEDSFGNDRDVRGELDLFLAQAELQRVQEAKRSGQWRTKFSLFSHGLALGLALFIAVAGLGGAYWWVHTQKAVPVPLVTQNPTSAGKSSGNAVSAPEVRQQQADIPSTNFKESTAGEQTKNPSAVSRETGENSLSQQPQPVHSVVSQDASEQDRPAEKAINLPPDEMQKLIREAGKSLRGQ